MPEALVHAGRWLRWVDASGRAADQRLIGPSTEEIVRVLLGGWDAADPGLLAWVRDRAHGRSVEITPEGLAAWLSQHGVDARAPPPDRRRALRRVAFSADAETRSLLLAYARARLAEGFRSPEASLSALAREEERVRRVLRRETNAAESWVSEGAPVLGEYARLSARTRAQLETHLGELGTAVEREVRRLAPNLSAVVGPVVAARLVTQAGGLRRLASLDSSRIQLLGARRRFGPGRSPRFGVLYEAEGMDQVPPARAGAFARSVAALAAIAARVDATSRRSVATELVRRRSRRIAQLRSRKP